MNKEQLFEKFKVLFPNWAGRAIFYKKIGSKTLKIIFASDIGVVNEIKNTSRVFLYNNEDDWQFGTKLWRKRPDKPEKINKEEQTVLDVFRSLPKDEQLKVYYSFEQALTKKEDFNE